MKGKSSPQGHRETQGKHRGKLTLPSHCLNQIGYAILSRALWEDSVPGDIRCLAIQKFRDTFRSLPYSTTKKPRFWPARLRSSSLPPVSEFTRWANRVAAPAS